MNYSINVTSDIDRQVTVWDPITVMTIYNKLNVTQRKRLLHGSHAVLTVVMQ